jgi:hypothetical protein
MVKDNKSGKMDLTIKVNFMKAKEKGKDSFIIAKMEQQVQEFGKMVYYKVKDNIYKEEKCIVAFGILEN